MKPSEKIKISEKFGDSLIDPEHHKKDLLPVDAFDNTVYLTEVQTRKQLLQEIQKLKAESQGLKTSIEQGRFYNDTEIQGLIDNLYLKVNEKNLDDSRQILNLINKRFMGYSRRTTEYNPLNKIIETLKQGEGISFPPNLGFKNINFKKSELSVLCGHSGQGKTGFLIYLTDYILNMNFKKDRKKDFRVMMFSFETPEDQIWIKLYLHNEFKKYYNPKLNSFTEKELKESPDLCIQKAKEHAINNLNNLDFTQRKFKFQTLELESKGLKPEEILNYDKEKRDYYFKQYEVLKYYEFVQVMKKYFICVEVEEEKDPNQPIKPVSLDELCYDYMAQYEKHGVDFVLWDYIQRFPREDKDLNESIRISTQKILSATAKKNTVPLVVCQLTKESKRLQNEYYNKHRVLDSPNLPYARALEEIGKVNFQIYREPDVAGHPQDSGVINIFKANYSRPQQRRIEIEPMTGNILSSEAL